MNNDLKYIVKRVIVGVLIGVILFGIKSCDVKAQTYVYPNVGLLFNNNEVNALAISNTSTGSDFNIKVAVSEATPLYFLIDSCTSQNYNDIEITNTSCTNSCILDGVVTVYKVGSCKINGYNANHVLLQLQVKKYEIDPNTTYYMSNSRIRFGGYGYYTQFHIWNYYASDEDIITALANQQMQYEDIKNTLNNQTSSIINNQNTNTQNIINNQNSNTQDITDAQQDTTDAINDLNDTMKDDTIDNSESNSFFNNFSDNTHGLSGIITAPLGVIQGLVNVSPTSCQDLSITYNNKTISLPCGSIFWGHSGFSSFSDFYNLVVGGLFSYLIIKNLFLIIEKLKDPDNDKVEVMEL